MIALMPTVLQQREWIFLALTTRRGIGLEQGRYPTAHTAESEAGYNNPGYPDKRPRRYPRPLQ